MNQENQIDPQIYLSLVERAGARCEWVYLNEPRCQNTLALKVHHRNYEHYGREDVDDLSLLCPAHHLIADVLRKQAKGQGRIAIERADWVLMKKVARLDEINANKFMARIVRELKTWQESFNVVSKACDRATGVIVNGRSWQTLSFDEWTQYLWSIQNSLVCSGDRKQAIFVRKIENYLCLT